MIEGISRGQTVAASARDAGYSSTSCKGTVYRVIKSSAIKRRTQEVLKTLEQNKCGVISKMVRSKRSALTHLSLGSLPHVLPDIDSLARARANGLTQYLKLKTTVRT